MTIRNAILGLLYQRPRHGYELYTTLEAFVGGEQTWAIKPAQVYTTLNRLHKSGLVTVPDADPDATDDKHIYTLTPDGEAELAAWLAEAVETSPQRDEFFVKLMIALATGYIDPYRLIYTQRAALYRQLHALTAQRADADPDTELAHILLLDRAAMHLEADLRWLAMIETRLDEIRAQPVPEPDVRPRGRPPKNRQIGG